MNIIVSERQYKLLVEDFAPITMFKYLRDRNTDDMDFGMYRWSVNFQKYVNLIYKYSMKKSPVDHLVGMKVWSLSHVGNGVLIHWRIILDPLIEKDTPIDDYEKMKIQYENFKPIFEKVAKSTGLDEFSPVKISETDKFKVNFDFREINPQQMVGYYKN